MRTCDPILDMAVSQADLEAMYRNNPAQAMRDSARGNSGFSATPFIKEKNVGFLVVENAPKRSKYGNIKVVCQGLRFDSKKELRCWQELELRQKAGEIDRLVRQVSFPLDVNGCHIGKFTADFCWFEKGEQVVADAKSPPTRKETAYRLRKKLFEVLYAPLVIREL